MNFCVIHGGGGVPMIHMGTSEKTDRAFQSRNGQWDVDLGISSFVDCWGWHSNAFLHSRIWRNAIEKVSRYFDCDDGLKIPLI